MKRYITLVFSILCAYAAQAQTGTIKGTIKDAKTGEAIIGASAVIEGTTIGAAADLDGNFIIPKVPVGTHSLVITFVSYQKKVIPNLVVESGKAVVVNTALDEETTQLTEVTVTAQRATNTEVAVISEIRMAQQVAVGVSSEQIMKSQDRDAAQIIRRVPGVSIIDNRFVMVRGLGQRYNAVLLNDVLTPSSEVDVRSFSFDMIPSNVIDRMIIYKSGAAELPGEFAGGVVKIYTKRAPVENFTNFSITGGFRGNTTFKSVQTYQGSKTDILGFDSGFRQLPNSIPSVLSSSFSAVERANYANQLKNVWSTQPKTVTPDFRLSFNLGRRFDIGSVNVGSLTAINYSNVNQYTDVALNAYETFDPIAQASPKAVTYDDELYRNTVRIGVVQNFSVKASANSRFEFKNIFNQLGFSETVTRRGTNFGNGVDEQNYSLRYENRSIYMGQLVGDHNFNGDLTTLNWQLGYAYTNRKEPDWRRFVTNRTSGTTNGDGTPAPFQFSIPGSPTLFDAARYFSNLNENVFTLGINGEHKLGNETENPIKFKAGIYAERKDRKFDARVFSYLVSPGADADLISQYKQLPFDQIFTPEHVNGTTGFTLGEDINPSFRYSANNTLLAGYLSSSLPLSKKLTAVAGIRVEYNDQSVIGKNSGGQSTPGGEAIVTPLPSLNLTYNLSDKALFRLAYAYTLNRPEFRELANFNFYDFNLNANIFGNPNLKIANIHNVDFRWEYYPSVSELISIGAFYKHFNNPIESFLLIGSGGASSLNYSYGNAKYADNYGVEVEVRKSFTELSNSRFIQNLSLVANASVIHSRIDLGEFVDLGPDAGGLVNVGANQDKTRPMMNQSPYLVNGGLYYNDQKSGWQANILYNVFGKRIFAVGNIFNPTVYELPRHVIDLTVSKRISKMEIRLGVQDILNQAFQLKQDSKQDGEITKADESVRTFKTGTYTTLNFIYNF
jgi:outer membrane cobalamin receptor